MAGPPGDSAARAVIVTWFSAWTTSPFGTCGESGDCGGPHTPSGNAPKGWMATFVNGQASTVAPCCQRRVSVGSTPATCMGAMPSACVGEWVDTVPPTSSREAGTCVVTVIENSAVTTNGLAVVPSGGCATAPFAPARGGTAPSLTIDEMARATPDDSSSRYLGTNCAAVSFGVVLSLDEPNDTLTSHGPTSTLARPWKSGPSTVTFAPADTENVMSPNHVSMVMPADMRAYAS